MKTKIKLLINPSKVSNSPNIYSILGQKKINIRIVVSILERYCVTYRLGLFFSCVLFLCNKKLVFVLIKKPTLYNIIKHLLNLNNFNGIEFSLIKAQFNHI